LALSQDASTDRTEKALLKLRLDLAWDRRADRGAGEHDAPNCVEGLDENARVEALLDRSRRSAAVPLAGR
jgi:hypothetical protein